jgi:hypothetical protein
MRELRLSRSKGPLARSEASDRGELPKPVAAFSAEVMALYRDRYRWDGAIGTEAAIYDTLLMADRSARRLSAL